MRLVVCRSRGFERCGRDAALVRRGETACVDRWADYEPEVIELESSWTSGSTIWTDDVLVGRTGTPIQLRLAKGAGGTGRLKKSGFKFIAAFRGRRPPWVRSLNPYAMRFITLILLFTPSSTLVLHRVVCTRQDPRIYFDKFRPNRLQRRWLNPSPAASSSAIVAILPHARRIPDALQPLFQHVHHRQRLIRRQPLQLHILFFTQLRPIT